MRPSHTYFPSIPPKENGRGADSATTTAWPAVTAYNAAGSHDTDMDNDKPATVLTATGNESSSMTSTTALELKGAVVHGNTSKAQSSTVMTRAQASLEPATVVVPRLPLPDGTAPAESSTDHDGNW